MADNNSNISEDQDFYGSVRFFGGVTFKDITNELIVESISASGKISADTIDASGIVTLESALVAGAGIQLGDGQTLVFDDGGTIFAQENSGYLDIRVGGQLSTKFNANGLQHNNLQTAYADDEANGFSTITGSNVKVVGVINGADDFIVLPTGTKGDEIKILCEASSNFEIRMPSGGGGTINTVDCSDDGTEYLATDTDIIIARCTATGVWVLQSITALGAVRSAVVPD